MFFFASACSSGSKSDLSECTTDTDCGQNAHCTDGADIRTCVCDDGFDGDGVTCLPLVDCSTNPSACDANATCEEVGNGINACVCNSGYQGDGGTCTDVDECATNQNDCHPNASCANTPGGFTCTCNSGYEGDGVSCNDEDECSLDTHNCNAANASCTNTEGGFLCGCQEGYTGDGITSCSDIDECMSGSHTCDVNATCTNEIGGYTCICNCGYTGDGETCTVGSVPISLMFNNINDGDTLTSSREMPIEVLVRPVDWVTRVDLYKDAVLPDNLLGTDTDSELYNGWDFFEVPWLLTSAQNGQAKIIAVATDHCGQTESIEVQFTIDIAMLVLAETWILDGNDEVANTGETVNIFVRAYNYDELDGGSGTLALEVLSPGGVTSAMTATESVPDIAIGRAWESQGILDMTIDQGVADGTVVDYRVTLDYSKPGATPQSFQIDGQFIVEAPPGACNENTYESGDGSQDAPFEICSAAQLKCLMGDSDNWDKHFFLSNYISLIGETEESLSPIGYTTTKFTGTFDGNDNTIYNFVYEDRSSNYVGLFGDIGVGGQLTNLVVYDAVVSGGDYVGGIVGRIGGGIMSNCHFVGRVRGDDQVGGAVGRVAGEYYGQKRDAYLTGNTTAGTVSGEYSVGGLVGANRDDNYNNSGTVFIEDNHSSARVSGAANVGGLVGWAGNPSVVRRCSATGNVSGSSSIGGLVGYGESSITECFTTGDVNGGDQRIGGIVGFGSFSNCYARGNVTGGARMGSLVGEGHASVGYSTGDVNVRRRCGSSGVCGWIALLVGDGNGSHLAGLGQVIGGVSADHGLVGSSGTDLSTDPPPTESGWDATTEQGTPIWKTPPPDVNDDYLILHWQ